MKTDFVAENPWYHGSPLELNELQVGSTITQEADLARVFSHRPTTVSVEDDGRIKHNGRAKGFLYRISESVHAEDILLVPRSTMERGKEWRITRPLRVTLIRATKVRPEERLISGRG